MVNNVGAHPGQHRQGVGTSLVVHVERTLRSEGEERARVLIVETSSGDAYEAARGFYARRGFHPEAVIREFYELGEDKIVFWQSWFEANRSAARCAPGCHHQGDMTTHESLRRFALALPEAAEQDHHGMVSFRVGNKIFATVPDHAHVRIMVDESEILAAVAENPLVCEPFYWGKRLACVVVDTRKARPELVTDLLTEAWLRKAPKRLAEGFRQPGTSW